MKTSTLSCLGAALVAAGLAPAAGAILWQKRPDPNRDLPSEAWDIPSDPYFTGIMIGPMYRPHGRIRKVTWYQDGGWGSDDDPPGWEKRVIQVFDDSGRCVETESWAMGFREGRHVVDMGSTSEPMQSTYWEFGQKSCTRTRVIRDARGKQRAIIRERLTPAGLPEDKSSPWVATEYEYDPSGSVREAVDYERDGSPVRRHRWAYDSQERVRDHRIEHCRFRQPEYQEEFLYLPNGLVGTRIAIVQGEPAIQHTSYAYDADSRVLSESVTIDGAECWRMVCTYDSDGSLAIRQVSDRRLDSSRNRPRSIQVEETFAGIDRPLTREVRDSCGRVLETGWWSYDDDARGNWIEKWSTGKTDSGGVTVMRVIEYAD